jgi:triosephosphate isomerase (TIM)
MRIPFIAGNWKMFKTVHESVVFAKELRSLVKDVSDVEIVIAPPFTAIHAVAEAARNTNIGVAAQDLFWEREGAFTGEISPAMILEAGAAYAIVGHSERRRLFGETDATVNRKTMAAYLAGLTPIVCVGETLAEREAGHTAEVVKRQLSAVIHTLAQCVPQIVVAYEPVWAIGTGRSATPEQAQDVHALLRAQLHAATTHSAEMKILYGGSVKADNAAQLFTQSDIDGGLIGGASLKAADFVAICRAAS